MNLQDQVKTHRKVIKHEVLSFSLAELERMYSADPKEINISPSFQRLFRWSREQQSNFIESLILEIPIPPLFFYEREQDGVWELLDGLQRLSTIIRFFNLDEVPKGCEGISGNENEWHYENQNDLTAPLQLLPGEYLTQLEGMLFSTLPVQLQLNLKRARLQIYILKRETDPMYKYEVFNRLNRGGAIIEDQEVRNCSIRMIDDEFPDFIQKLGKNEDFTQALGLSASDMKNAYLDELVLRFFTVKNSSAHFKHDVDQFLTDYMKDVAKNTIKFDYAGEEALFKSVWKTINAAISDGEAFRAKRPNGSSVGPFSPSLFEMISVGVAMNIERMENLPPNDTRERIVSLIQEAKKQGLTGAGSNSRPKFLRRISVATEWFAS